MKRILILVAVLLLSSALSWAQTAGTAPAPVADPRTGGGHCQLPNLAGLTPEQRAAAVLNAGLQVTYADVVVGSPYPACPTTFKCNSIDNCKAGSVCNFTVIGRCCHDGSAVLCCQDGGDIAVDRCACECPLNGGGCSTVCLNSTNVSISCFLVPAS
jgi:hypothetical protein